MSKEFILLLVITLALASAAGYLYLSGEIASGEKQIADGQRLLEEGRLVLAKGKAALEAGKRELSDGKEKYARAKDNPILVSADKLLKGGNGFRGAKEQIAEGDRRVVGGEGTVAVWEKKLDDSGRELSRGTRQIRLAKGVRVAGALVAAILVALAIALGFRWRQALTWRLTSASGRGVGRRPF
jgi:hypothetical protein